MALAPDDDLCIVESDDLIGPRMAWRIWGEAWMDDAYERLTGKRPTPLEDNE
jgi:hypothetical protein